MWCTTQPLQTRRALYFIERLLFSGFQWLFRVARLSLCLRSSLCGQIYYAMTMGIQPFPVSFDCESTMWETCAWKSVMLSNVCGYLTKCSSPNCEVSWVLGSSCSVQPFTVMYRIFMGINTSMCSTCIIMTYCFPVSQAHPIFAT